MTNFTRQQHKEIFAQALELPSTEQKDFLQSACDGRPELYRELSSLLEAYDQSSEFLEDDAVSTLIGDNPDGELFGSPPDQPTSSAAIPKTIGSCRIIQEIGRGGLGIVYEAIDERLGRAVAVKTLRSGLATEEECNRFEREARECAKIEHKNVVQIFEVGRTAEGTPFIIMELLPGMSLDRLIQQAGPLPEMIATTLFLQAARGLEAIHQRGLVHRDIKPANLFIANVQLEDIGNGAEEFANKTTCKILDFGLARFDSEPSDFSKDNAIAGTPAYLSPEQIRDPQNVDQRSDLFSLGVSLYQAITGEKPFRGSIMLMLNRIETAEPTPPTHLNEKIPLDLESICLKALEKDPSRRYLTAKSFGEDLNRFSKGVPTVARPISRFEKAMRAVKRRPKVSLLVGALAISLIFVAVFATAYATIVGVKNREILARQQANQELLLQNILDARPESLELAIDNLKRADFDGLARLKEMEANRNLTVQQQANLTLTLALLGEIKVDAICNLVNELPATPWLCEIMVAALEPKSEEAHDALQRRIEDTGDPDKKSRWATVLMYLGEPNRSLEILSTTGKNGDRRYDWITSFPSWHGNWNATLEILKQTDHEDLRGALMTAVGLMRRRIIPNHNSIADTVRQIYQENENATTHSIAEWMLREWEAALPKLEADTHLPASRGWVLAPNGLTLIRIKSGEFLMGDTQQEQQATRNLHPVRITKSFYLSSTEVPRGVWEKIKQDKEFLAQYGMNAQQFDADIKTSPTQQHPAQALSWDAAVVFCNWLSENEDLEPCYSPTLENETANKDSSGDQSAGNRWVWNRDANGYRLPTEAEWEYACRAGSTSRYYFGSLDRRAYLFSHSSNRRPIPTLPTGSLIPNAFGLFDMHGNVWEWTWDWYDVFDEEPQTDPMGSENPVKEHGAVKVFRGGGVATMSGDSDSDARGYTATSSRFFNLGLRVARNAD